MGLGQGPRLRMLFPEMFLRSDVLPRSSVREMFDMVGMDPELYL